MIEKKINATLVSYRTSRTIDVYRRHLLRCWEACSSRGPFGVADELDLAEFERATCTLLGCLAEQSQPLEVGVAA